jgi:hypothetical protein
MEENIAKENITRLVECLLKYKETSPNQRGTYMYRKVCTLFAAEEDGMELNLMLGKIVQRYGLNKCNSFGLSFQLSGKKREICYLNTFEGIGDDVKEI